MVVPEDRELVNEHVRRFLAGEDSVPIEHRIIRKDGKIRWVSDTAVPYKDAAGKLLSYDGLIKDITEKKRLGEELDKHRHHLENLVETRTHELARGQGRSRGGERGQERLRCQHEPRDTHAPECDRRAHAPVATRQSRSRANGEAGQNRRCLPPPALGHQRHTRLFQNRGGQAESERRRFFLRPHAGQRRLHDRPQVTRQGSGTRRGAGRLCRRCWWAIPPGWRRPCSTIFPTPSNSPSAARSPCAFPNQRKRQPISWCVSK